MSAVYLESVGVLAAGLPDWPTARRVLSGAQAFDAAITAQPNPLLLPQNERRRVPKLVRWAIAAAQEAMSGAGRAAADVTMVFTSSSGDGEIVHKLCEAVAAPPREVSPTLFHNSVHNAAPGYWSIGAGSRQGSVALSGHDASFAVGLLEAASLVLAEQACVLLVACDLPYPDPLSAQRAIEASFGVAVLLTHAPGTGALGRWEISIESGAESTRFPGTLPRTLASNPAAHALPLLAAVACDAAATVPLTYVGGRHVAVEVRPCR
ncbi:MAG TPA: beta-ketoacyl synthase chain length factor [Burkholderiales bacterium]|nr:beta-ketoacyl synthase chain length factor [Burkholderiales bacterium]